ncbi:MAG: hypothetical protein WCZ28_17225 [Burkholderiaceae bacterium]
MRTLILIAVGLVLALASLRIAPAAWRNRAAISFTLAWLGVCAWNLATGLSHGYTLAQELPIHVFLYGVPVALAWTLARRRKT